MRGFLRRVLEYPTATVLVLLMTSFAGIYSMYHMPVDLFPGMNIPLVNIISHYPGAAPPDMELLVTRPIEDEMRTMPGIKRVASTTVQGVSLVSVEFNSGTKIAEARQLVQARLARLGGTLPTGVEPRIENIGTTLQEVAGYVVYGAGDPVRLRTIVSREIGGRLRAVDGVSSIEVLGGDQRAYYVTMDPATLSRLGLTIPSVVAEIKRYNRSAVAGFMVRSGREYLIRADGRLRTIEDIRAIPVKRDARGAAVLLGDIASVRKGKAPRHYVVRGDGKPAVALLVRKQPGASTMRVVSGVDEAMAGLRSLLPPGTRVKKFYDQSEIITESRHEVVLNLVEGAVLAVLVLYFFLGSMAPTLIVAVTIPLTLLATVAIMHLLGLGFNVITMTALTLSIGMIVDDAIVVAENIFRSKETMPSVVGASIEGAAGIAGPDASGTFTTVAAFLPFVLVTGMAAVFLRPFAMTIASALVVSLVLSLTLVPLLFSRKKGALDARREHLGGRALARTREWLIGLLNLSLRHGRWVILVSIAALGLAGLTLLWTEASFLPPVDEGALLVEYVMPPGTSLRESNRMGEIIERVAMADPDVSTVYRRTGSPEVGHEIEGVNMGELLIKLRPVGVRRRDAAKIMNSLKRAYSAMQGMVFLFHQPTQEKIDESFSGLPALFGVTIYGPDTDKLRVIAGEVEKVLEKDPAIDNVINNTKIRTPEVRVRLDYPALARRGLEPSDVFASLSAARFGVEATRIIRQREDVRVIVRLDSGEVLTPDDIRRLPVGGGVAIPLEGVAKVSIGRSPAAITRINGQREVTLVAEVGGNIPGLVKRLKRGLRGVKLPPGYSIEFAGEYRVLMKTALEMALILGAALVLIYIIMVMQFHTLIQPLIILATIPISFTGALFAVFVTGRGIDVSVAMGVVTLAGIAVNNAIVLMDFFNSELRAGKDVHGALVSAVAVRLRPILLTSTTTIAALLPTVTGVGAGSRIFQPFAITVTGGLFSASLATLIVVPTLASMCSLSRGAK